MILIPFIVLLVTVVAVVRNRSRQSDTVLNGVPGPKRLPLIGNLHIFASRAPPHHVLRELAAKHGALMRLQLGEVPYLVVSSAEVAAQVLKTHDVAFANRPPILAAEALAYNSSDIGNAPYGEYWRQLRKMCTVELLSGKRVRNFRPIREEENANVARSIACNQGSPNNLTEMVYLSSFDITTRAAIGKLTEEKPTITAAVKQIMKIISVFTLADLYPSLNFLPLITGFNFKIQKIFQKTDRILERIIDQHRFSNPEERRQDLADILLNYQPHDAQFRLSTDNIKAVILGIFLAGGETSATVIDWAMSEMITNPTTLKTAQDEVRRVFDDKGYVDEEKFDELKYLKLVIKETLRMHPPLPLLVRRQNSSERCEINGYEIPGNTRVLINAWALGRDPKYWSDDAEKFKPERFEDAAAAAAAAIDFKGNNLEYIPFGAGRRICPGMSFGLANVESTLAMLLYHFDWEMPNGIRTKDLDMSEDFGASVKRRNDLVLIPTLKRPLQTL